MLTGLRSSSLRCVALAGSLSPRPPVPAAENAGRRATGPRSARCSGIRGVATTPPTHPTTTHFTDGMLLGNGDIGVTVGGTKPTRRFLFGKGDFWGRASRASQRLDQRCSQGLPARPGPDAQRYYASDALTVDVASARYLLAMKLFSSRVENDADDILVLYRQLGYTTVEEGVALVESVYRGRPIAVRARFLLAEIVAALREQGPPPRMPGDGQP